MNNIDNLDQLRAIASNSRLVTSITIYSDLKSINTLKKLLTKRILDEAGVTFDTDIIVFEPLWRYQGLVKSINRQRLIYLAEVEFSNSTSATYLDRYN